MLNGIVPPNSIISQCQSKIQFRNHTDQFVTIQQVLRGLTWKEYLAYLDDVVICFLILEICQLSFTDLRNTT